MKYIAFILRPPSFEDEDKSRAAALLHFILVATTIANIGAIVARPLLAGETLYPVSANIVVLLVQIGLFALMWNGRLRVAGFILTVFVWFILSLGAYYNTGILNPIFGAQTVVIVMAGLLINEWAALGFAVLSSAFGLWLVLRAEVGIYPSTFGTITAQITWANATTAFVVTGLLLFLSLRTIREVRKRAVEHARDRAKSDERYRSLVENAPDTIFTLDRNFRITYLNRSTLGPVETLIGHSAYDFLPPDSHDAYRAAVNRVLESGSTEQIEVHNVGSDKQSDWYSMHFAPVWEGKKVVEVTAISTTITEKKRAEAALRDSEEQYRQLFESNPHPMFVADLKTLKFLAVNDAAVEKYGYSRDEFLRMTTNDLRLPEDVKPAAELVERYEREGLNYLPLGVRRHIKKDGSLFLVELNINRITYEERSAVLGVSYDLTERLRAEQAVRESEARLKARIDSAMDAIITINESQQIVQFNPAAEQMFQVAAAEIIGQPIDRLIPERFREKHGDHIRAFGQTGVTNRRMGALGAISGRRANGEEFPIEASISQFDVGTGKFYSVILRDITERKRAEDAIRRSEELFSTIFQSVPVAITIVSLTTGNIISVNDYLLKLVGYGYTEIVGRPVLEAPFWTNAGDLQALFQPFIEEGQPMNGVETQWRTQSDQILVMLGSAVQIEIHGEPCMLGLALDITERKQAERIKLEVYKERELLEVKENFISRMSHDFRTPLAVILTANEMLRRYYDRMTPERREEHFQNVENQVRFATQILDDVLTLSKERAGKMPFNPAPINLVAACERLFLQMQTADSVGHGYIFVSDGETGAFEGDEKLLQHILINLLSNAIKYSPAGGAVRFEVRREDDSAVLAISDQGIGIPEEDQMRLFEPFYRASNTGSINGTGLGLAIVKESVETHRGTIRCESAPGQGTMFEIRLPINATV